MSLVKHIFEASKKFWTEDVLTLSRVTSVFSSSWDMASGDLGDGEEGGERKIHKKRFEGP